MATSSVQPADRAARRVRPRPLARQLLHVFPSFDIGGAQARFAALAALLGDNYAHTVISLSGRCGAAALLPPGAPVAFLEPPAAGAGPLQRLTAYRDLLKRLSPELLVTYNWGAMEFAWANLGLVPHLHMEDGFGPEEASRQLARRVWGRRVGLAYSQLVVPSETLFELALRRWRLPPGRVRHIPNAVPSQHGYATRLEDLGLPLPPGRTRIAWAGALRAEKNPLRLLQAFAPLRDQAILVVIGDGPERDRMLAEAARLGVGDSLQLVGRRSDARDLIMQCDLLALSSDTEQMPLVVLEAMDAGLAVASVDVGDVRRMLAEENRPYVTPLDPVPLGRALAALVESPAMRRAIGEANRRRARSVYTTTRMVSAYDKLMRQLIAHPHAHA
jgi:glycosyltransferase involved in cell wall biosynthesis